MKEPHGAWAYKDGCLLEAVKPLLVVAVLAFGLARLRKQPQT